MEFDTIPGAPGWFELRTTDSRQPRILVKAEMQDGRRAVTRLVMASHAIDLSAVRAMPVGRIEAMANHPMVGESAEAPGAGFAKEFAEIEHALNDYLRESAVGPVPINKPSVVRRKRRPQLTRPDGTDPDGFSRQVAAAYSDAALKTAAPAVVLADEAGVPVGTVHRWIREARQRGHLPPARKGRAG